MDQKKKIENLFLRLMEDETLSSEELDMLKEYLVQHPEESKEMEGYFQIWTKLDSYREVDDEIINQKWSKNNITETQSSNFDFRKRFAIVSRYAAIFVLGILISSLVIYQINNNSSLSKTSQTFDVPLGSSSSVTLADGTEAVLNAGSRLSYKYNYGKKIRSVKLSGEAYFKVTKDKHKPFVVETDDITVRAYGTEFNVKSYPDEENSVATLVEGSIGVEINNIKNNKQKELFLKPNEQVTVNKAALKQSLNDQENLLKDGIITISKNIDHKLYTSWVNGRLNLQQETLEGLIVKLERKYNVKIQVEDESLKELKFTGIFENETIEQVMNALKLSSPINFKIKERDIWLTRNEDSNY